MIGEGEESRQGEYEGEEMAEEGERMERGEEEGDEGEDIALESTGNALNLQYVLGFNKQIPGGVHDLTGPDRTVIYIYIYILDYLELTYIQWRIIFVRSYFTQRDIQE